MWVTQLSGRTSISFRIPQPLPIRKHLIRVPSRKADTGASYPEKRARTITSARFIRTCTLKSPFDRCLGVAAQARRMPLERKPESRCFTMDSSIHLADVAELADALDSGLNVSP